MSWVIVDEVTAAVENIDVREEEAGNDAVGADGGIGSCGEVNSDIASGAEVNIDMASAGEINSDMASVGQIQTEIEQGPVLEEGQGEPAGDAATAATLVKRMKVVKCTEDKLALTNCAIVNIAEFSVDVKYIAVSRSGINANKFVFSIKFCPQVERGKVSFNPYQREWANLSPDQEVDVEPYYFDDTSHFEILSNITLEADFLLDNTTKSFDTKRMAKDFLGQFSGQPFTVGQQVLFPYKNKKYMFRLVVKSLEVTDAKAIQSGQDAKPKKIRMARCIGDADAIKFERAPESTLNLVTKVKPGELVQQTGVITPFMRPPLFPDFISNFLSTSRSTPAKAKAVPKSAEVLERLLSRGIIEWGWPVTDILADGKLYIQQVLSAEGPGLVSVLLRGPANNGKTALAAQIAKNSGIPCVKVWQPDDAVLDTPMSDADKCASIRKIFDKAYRSKLSCVLLDNIERLLDFCPIGQKINNLTLQALLVLLKKQPPPGHKLLILCTSSCKPDFLANMQLFQAFTAAHHVPCMTSRAQILSVLEKTDVFSQKEREEIMAGLRRHRITCGIKRLLDLIDMTRQVEPNCRVNKFLSKMKTERLIYYDPYLNYY